MMVGIIWVHNVLYISLVPLFIMASRRPGDTLVPALISTPCSTLCIISVWRCDRGYTTEQTHTRELTVNPLHLGKRAGTKDKRKYL